MLISYLTFENEDDAIRFHKGLVEGSTTFGAKLVGTYKIPTKFCNQQEPFPHKRDGWAMLQKRGWWVCSICKRPSALPTFKMSNFGHNIMEQVTNAEFGDTL